jgi:hypothetical protein
MKFASTYIEFVKGALLSSDELNTSFSYLMNRDKAALQLFAGVGIVEGLEVTIAADGTSITISAGVAVTADGDLICLDASSVFNFETNGVLSNSATPNLNAKVLEGKCIAFGFKKDKRKITDCFVRSESGNFIVECKPKVFLVNEPAATTPINAGSVSNCFKYPCLLPLTYKLDDKEQTERVDLASIKTTGELFKQYKIIVDKGILDIVESYKIIANCYKDLFCGEDFNGLVDTLNGLFTTIKIEDAILCCPYLYDYLQTLVAAYQEFVATEWVVRQRKNMGNAALTDTVLLGNGKGCKCRQTWQPSLTNSTAYQEAKFYAQRMIVLTKADSLIFKDIISGKKTLKITPSRQYTPLSRKAIPFYFEVQKVKPYWSYALHQTQGDDEIPTYDDAHNKMFCNTEGWRFYRTEGHIGKDLTTVMLDLNTQRQNLNAAFNIVPLFLPSPALPVREPFDWDKIQLPVDGIFIPFSTDDLEREFNQHKLKILCQLWQFEQQSSSRVIVSIVEIVDMLCFRTFNFKEFKDKHSKALDKLITEGKLPDKSIYCLFDYFKVLERIYRSRLKQTFFSDFVLCHDGAQNESGTMRGGTLLLIYTNLQRNIKVTDGQVAAAAIDGRVVIADFMLPCCDIDWYDVPTAVFSIEITSQFNRNEQNVINVMIRNLSVNADRLSWKVEINKNPIATQSDACDNQQFVLKEGDIKFEQENTLRVVLEARKGERVSVYEEIVTITKPFIPQVVVGGQKAVIDLSEIPVTPKKSPLKSIESTTKGLKASSAAVFNQRHDAYKKIVSDIETDTSINDNKSFNLGKLLVFYPNVNNIATDYATFVKSANNIINLSGKLPERQAKYYQLLETATHLYWDKLVAEGAVSDADQKNIKALKDFYQKKEKDINLLTTAWGPSVFEGTEAQTVVEVILKSTM